MGAGDPGSVETDVERLGDRRHADAALDDVKATGSSGGGRENVRRKRHLLVASSCILGTELCERLAFVGLATNLALYLVRYMDYSAARASQMLQIWKGMVFTTPLIGAYLADAYLGRFRTILLFSVVYMAGLAGITGVNLSPTLQPRRGQPPPSGEYGPTIAAFWAFMYLIALGSGGIKPCVGSFGADNFDEQRPIERRWRSTYFIWYYCSINLGGLIAALAITPIQEAKGYGIGFAIPTVFFGAAVATLIVGASFKLYRFVPPEGSPLKRVFLVLKCALVTNRGLPRPGEGTELYDPPPGEGGLEYRMARTPRYPWLDRAALRHGRPDLRQPTLTEVEETKALMGLGPILVVTALFMCFRDPLSTLLPLTGDTMDRRIGGRGERVPAASLSFANPAGMLLSVMIYDALVAPAFARMGRPITPMQRLGAGIFLQVFALLAAGFLEIARYKAVADTGLLATFDAAKAYDPTLNPGRGPYFVPISVWWQVVPYFLEGISETLAFAAATEIVYTQVVA